MAAGVSCTARSPAFSITSGPSARRSFESTTLSACAWPAGASSPHSAAIRRSRVTARLAVEREMGEGQPALTAGKISLPSASIDADREMATQFDGHIGGCQASRLLGLKSESSRASGPMANRLTFGCDAGYAKIAAQVFLSTLPLSRSFHGGPWRRRWKVRTIRSVCSP